MSFDGYLYFYGFVLDANGKKITKELEYSIEVTEYLVEFFVHDEKIFECFDDLEDGWQDIPAKSLYEAMEYLAFDNDWVRSCRSDSETDFIKYFNDSAIKLNGTKAPKGLNFNLRRIELFGHCVEC
jgi:hypothetical protein